MFCYSVLRFGLLKCKKRSSGFMSASSTIEVQFGYPDFNKHNRTKILAPTKQNLQSSQKCIIGPFILYFVILSQIETFSEQYVFCVDFLEPKNGLMLNSTFFSYLNGRAIPRSKF